MAMGVSHLCAVSEDQFWDEQFGVPGVPYEEGVVSALLAVGNDLYVGGTFTSIGGLATTSIARWDGPNWHALGNGIDGTVDKLVLARGEPIAGGHFLSAGGHFTEAGGVPASKVAQWDGDQWWAPGTNFTLEAKESLQATTWSEVPQPPAVLDSELFVTQSVSGTSELYRLQRR